VYFTVTCDGVPIGATELEGWGVRAGPLARLPAYEAFGLSGTARRLGIALLALRWSRVPAIVAARAYRGARTDTEALEPRLGLVNVAGAAVPTPRLALVEFPRRSALPGTYIIADLGEAGAGRGAVQHTSPPGRQDSSRPAA
jgi:hypothetical protein